MRFSLYLVLFLGFAVSAECLAQRQQAEPQQQSRARAWRSFPKTGFTYTYWSERVLAERPGASSQIPMQFAGLSAYHQHVKPLRRGRGRWRRILGAEIAAGTVKGQGVEGVNRDGLKDQPWLYLAAVPALSRRMSRETELGVGLPVSFRKVLWQLRDDNLEMKEENFSVGASLYFLTHLSARSAVRVSLTQQQQWESTVFSVGYEWRPRKFLWHIWR